MNYQETITAVNPTSGSIPARVKKAPPHTLREHGIGLDILKQIAERYCGTVRTDVQNKTFMAVVQLNLAGFEDQKNT